MSEFSEFADVPDLPVREHLPRIVEASRNQAVVVVAPPGSGKTMLVAAALLDDLLPTAGQVWLIQPRRLAARAVARHIAMLRGVPLGSEVGYHVRFDRKAGPATRLLVMTTGILLRTLVDDTSLAHVAAVVLDEFHERTLEMDESLGMLCRLRQTIRPDLRLAVMSATMDPGPIVRHLEPCALIQAEGRRYPVEIRYQRRRDDRRLEAVVADVVPEMVARTPGNVLVFLPGVGEILRCREALEPFAQRNQIDLAPLYGDLPPEQQDAVVTPGPQRRIVLATNVAETSLTIPGVTAVIDSGLARVLQVAPSVGIPRLELQNISQASADQRAGRAGRTAPGICHRLWEQASHAARPTADTPEIRRSDFTEPLLRLLTWGERDPIQFPWLDPPHADSITKAFELLRLLGAIDSHDKVTSLGADLVRLPAHPRLARLIVAGMQQGVLREASIAAALLSERDPFRVAERTGSGPRDIVAIRSRSDMVDRVLAVQGFYAQGKTRHDNLECHPGGTQQVLRVADQYFSMVESQRSSRATDPVEALMRCMLDAFPDRLAKLRANSSDRGLLVGGRGVRIDSRSAVRGEPLFLCLDLNDASGDAVARCVSAVDLAWLSEINLSETEAVFFNPTRGRVEARRRLSWIDLVLKETPVELTDMPAAAGMLAELAIQHLDRWHTEETPAGRFRNRILWLSSVVPELELPSLENPALLPELRRWAVGMRSLEELRQGAWLSWFQELVGYHRLVEVDRLAPEHVVVPSGNRIKLEYGAGKPPVLAVRIQEMFGLTETPRVAGGRQSVLLHLLGPNHRPQQVTDDLASFWQNTYPQVRKDLRRRYPKHAWPEDPLAR